VADKNQRRRALAAVGVLALGGAVALVAAPASGPSPKHPRPTPPTGQLSGPPSSLRPAPLRAGPPAQPAPANEQLGANIGLLFNLRIYTQAEIAAQLSALARTGAALVRADAPWEATEPRPPVGGFARYNWRFDDQIAGALAAHRLQWLPVIDYSPPWARSVPGVDHSAPTAPAAYAAYARAFAARYGPRGSFWRAHPGLHAEPVRTYEIWNEPDSAFFWKPRPNPAAYARLYLLARSGIKSVRPGARVIIGGLTRPERFVPALLSAQPGLRGHIDGVGIHPYGRDPQAVLARVRTARLALRSAGMAGVPLYVTEFGWRTRPPGGFGFAAPNLRPGFILRTIAALRQTDCGVAAVLLYAWSTPELDPAAARDWFGIDPPTATAGPAVAAFADALSAHAPRASATTLCSG
jgi:polysaccharide biosynthesis protein PslG